ncbi:hypothetical protein [Brachybacterium hainanense]|uniref:Uncharacterized protein n=1 Tax=Brachybacterium hainanense TaxID=1541174 RepID=A0ABV6RBJ4_9MICO
MPTSPPAPSSRPRRASTGRIPTDALHQDAVPDAGASLSVLVVADPGLPTRRFLDVEPLVHERLGERLGVDPAIEVRSALVETRPDGSLLLAETASTRASGRFSATVVLTEMPRCIHGELLVAEVFPQERLAALFWPTLGIIARRTRIAEVAADSIVHALDGDAPDRAGMPRRRSAWAEDPERDALLLHARRLTGPVRTVIGMVVTNAPWRTARKLSSALAAASAAGAFGIFYNSIWQMAAALSTARLLVIGLLSMTVMVLWLVLRNGLWDRAGPERGPGVAMLYNLSTLATLFLCVLALYVVLVVLILISGAIVIDPSFMSDVLGQPARFSHYMGIAWLSAAMGVVAGGIGSSFDPETDVRQLTHGMRERQRTSDEHR